MYIACRHIHPNGLRCKSRTLKDRDFCYHHARLDTRIDPYANLDLPIPEDSAAVLLSLHRISQAVIRQTLDLKRARLLVYMLQIASMHIDRKKPFVEADTVPSVAATDQGDELAPELRVCAKDELCDKCPHANDCANFHEEDPNDPNVLMRTLISLGKHLDDPCPPGFFPPDEENDQQTEQQRKQIKAWRKRWGQPTAFQQESQATDPRTTDPRTTDPAVPSPSPLVPRPSSLVP